MYISWHVLHIKVIWIISGQHRKKVQLMSLCMSERQERIKRDGKVPPWGRMGSNSSRSLFEMATNQPPAPWVSGFRGCFNSDLKVLRPVPEVLDNPHLWKCHETGAEEPSRRGRWHSNMSPLTHLRNDTCRWEWRPRHCQSLRDDSAISAPDTVLPYYREGCRRPVSAPHAATSQFHKHL